MVWVESWPAGPNFWEKAEHGFCKFDGSELVPEIPVDLALAGARSAF